MRNVLHPGETTQPFTKPYAEAKAPTRGAARDRELAVEIVGDERAFLALEDDWNRLVEKANIDHPFLSHEWVRSWWRSFGAGNDLHILRVHDGDETVAIAPLMAARGRIWGLKVRKLEFLANVHTPRFDFIVAERAHDAYRALWRSLVARAERWDVIELNQLLVDSQSMREISRLAAESGFPTGTWRSEDCPYVDFTQGWPAYLQSLSHNHRSQMRKRLKRLARLGAVELEVIAPDGHWGAALEDGLAIEAAAWKARAGTAILCRPEVADFYRRIAEETARLGTLRLVFLNVAGKRIAFAFALCYKQTLFVLKAGYEPDYAPYSPYQALCFLLFEDACNRGLTGYEFLGASDAWKLHWTKIVKPQGWLYVFSPTLRTACIHAAKFRLAPMLQRASAYRALRTAIARAIEGRRFALLL